MNTKQIGNIAEIAFIYECVKRNNIVSIPYGDNARYDFIIEHNNKLIKIQVKHMKNHKDFYIFSCKSQNWNKGPIKNYKNDVDYIFGYCKDDNIWVLVPIKEANNSSMTIRKTLTRNNQKKKTNYLKYYQHWFDYYDAD